jgi:endonuclease/exonuclease/phosphatase family metal-dependent hydrolase
MVGQVCARGRAWLVLGGLAALLGAPAGARAQGAAVPVPRLVSTLAIAMNTGDDLSAVTDSEAASTDEIVLHAKNASRIEGNWTLVQDSTAAGGARLWNPDAAAAKLPAALSSPTSFFELTFSAEANRGYRFWMRGRADRNSWANDSVYVQFSGAVSATGTRAYQIGSTSAIWVGIEDCSGCGLHGWGWQDNAYGTGALGPLVYFATSGPQTIRIQQREDGISIDQIVLSAGDYVTLSPGATKDDGTILAATGTVVASTDSTVPVVRDEIVIGAGNATLLAGAWRMLSDTTAAQGIAVGHPDAGAAKLAAPKSSPVNYVELTFDADAGKPYRLWLRARADRDSWANDSVFVQFNQSLNAAGARALRIGSTDALTVNLEDASGAGVSGWGWQDAGYGAGVLGPLVTFETSGTQTVRIQTREDGIRIDQVVLSAVKYLSVAPGALKNDATILTQAAPAPVAASAQLPAETSPPPADTPPPAGPIVIRVLQWNLHHGVGTDGVYNLDRIATWMAKMSPDVVMLNEVEKYTGWGNENQPERYRTMLETKTGKRWYSHFTQEYGSWTANGKGSQILSTYPFDSTDQTLISYVRVIGAATITVNGRLLTLMETHLDPDSQAYRLTQAKQVITWASARPENRIISGDFNAWPDQTSIAEMRKTYADSWDEAAKIGKALTFAGNSPIGATKNGRIDYIFYSRGAANLTLVQSQVYDTRSSAGVMPSDHRPVVTTFEVR